jgi:K+-transporting ATPase ATPase C chain
MWSQVRPALVSLLLFTLITGAIYPLLVTAIARVVFPRQASGSVIERDGKAVGSELIGQPFSDPRYFWPRPSATGPVPYNAAAGSGSNQAPTNPALADAVRQRTDALRAAHPDQTVSVPVDLVTASGSGLDPHISPAAARYQLGRVARARGMTTQQVQQLVDRATDGRTLGVLGEPRVNVLRLNLMLDDLARSAAAN